MAEASAPRTTKIPMRCMRKGTAGSSAPTPLYWSSPACTYVSPSSKRSMAPHTATYCMNTLVDGPGSGICPARLIRRASTAWRFSSGTPDRSPVWKANAPRMPLSGSANGAGTDSSSATASDRARRHGAGRLPDGMPPFHEQRNQADHVLVTHGLGDEPLEGRHGVLDAPPVDEGPGLLGAHAGATGVVERLRQQAAVDEQRLVEVPGEEQGVGQRLEKVVGRGRTGKFHGAAEVGEAGLDGAVAQRS